MGYPNVLNRLAKWLFHSALQGKVDVIPVACTRLTQTTVGFLQVAVSETAVSVALLPCGHDVVQIQH
jgi:hypothetical protein